MQRFFSFDAHWVHNNRCHTLIENKSPPAGSQIKMKERRERNKRQRTNFAPAGRVNRTKWSCMRTWGATCITKPGTSRAKGGDLITVVAIVLWGSWHLLCKAKCQHCPKTLCDHAAGITKHQRCIQHCDLPTEVGPIYLL